MIVPTCSAPVEPWIPRVLECESSERISADASNQVLASVPSHHPNSLEVSTL